MTRQITIKGKPIIFGVALGPGDPDLITVKGLKILQEVDVIYYPGARFSNGKQSSYAWSIITHYQLNEDKCKGFYLDMNLDRASAEQTYVETFQNILIDYKAGLSIAIVSEGDVSTYSSFSYLLRHIQAQNLEVALVPGITSYNLAAAEQQVPLCLQDEQMMVLPRVQDAEMLKEAIGRFDCLVLMKIKSSINLIHQVLKQEKKVTLFYFERLGTPQQFTSSNWDEILNRNIPYFSLIIVRK
mgnify:CR=1 FL=1